MTTPSTGTTSPARTTSASPISTSSTATSSTAPPAPRRRAILGARATSAVSSRRARPAAASSRAFPPASISETTAAAAHSWSARAPAIAIRAIASTPTSRFASDRATLQVEGDEDERRAQSEHEVAGLRHSRQVQDRPGAIATKQAAAIRRRVKAPTRSSRWGCAPPGERGRGRRRRRSGRAGRAPGSGRARRPRERRPRAARAGARGRRARRRRPAACPRKPSTSLPALPVSTRSSASPRLSGSDPELRLSDQLGEDAAGAERDERAEGRILDDAREQLGAAVDHRLDEHRQPDPLDGGRDVGLGGEVERDPAALGLVRAGNAALDDDREARARGRRRARPRALSSIRSGTSGMPYAPSSVRTCGAVSHASLEDSSTDATSACAAGRSIPSRSGVPPAGRRSQSARSAACASARAADSG